jgi:hypothetical protein
MGSRILSNSLKRMQAQFSSLCLTPLAMVSRRASTKMRIDSLPVFEVCAHVLLFCSVVVVNVTPDLLWWSIRAPTAADVKAAAENPPKRAKRGTGVSSSFSATPTQPLHVLEMHFIQVKVGKLKYDLLGSSLSEAVRFADDHRQFENVQCGQMTGVGQDAAWNTALLAAATAACAAAAAAAAPTHAKQYELEAHFHLVTSKNVSAPTRKFLQDASIQIAFARDHSFWGPRADCSVFNQLRPSRYFSDRIVPLSVSTATDTVIQASLKAGQHFGP